MSFYIINNEIVFTNNDISTMPKYYRNINIDKKLIEEFADILNDLPPEPDYNINSPVSSNDIKSPESQTIILADPDDPQSSKKINTQMMINNINVIKYMNPNSLNIHIIL